MIAASGSTNGELIAHGAGIGVREHGEQRQPGGKRPAARQPPRLQAQRPLEHLVEPRRPQLRAAGV